MIFKFTFPKTKNVLDAYVSENLNIKYQENFLYLFDRQFYLIKDSGFIKYWEINFFLVLINFYETKS